MSSGNPKPNKIANKPLHFPKCSVWVAISTKSSIGPMFFKKSGATATVLKERYVEVFKAFNSKLETLFPSLVRKFLLQQDGTSPYTSNLSRDGIKENSGGHVISIKTNFE